MNEMNALVHVI